MRLSCMNLIYTKNNIVWYQRTQRTCQYEIVCFMSKYVVAEKRLLIKGGFGDFNALRRYCQSATMMKKLTF